MAASSNEKWTMRLMVRPGSSIDAATCHSSVSPAASSVRLASLPDCVAQTFRRQTVEQNRGGCKSVPYEATWVRACIRQQSHDDTMRLHLHATRIHRTVGITHTHRMRLVGFVNGVAKDVSERNDVPATHVQQEHTLHNGWLAFVPTYGVSVHRGERHEVTGR